jgi:hypothetical protein
MLHENVHTFKIADLGCERPDEDHVRVDECHHDFVFDWWLRIVQPVLETPWLVVKIVYVDIDKKILSSE